MTDLSSDKLRSLLEEASPGPWSIKASSEYWGLVVTCTIKSLGGNVATAWQQYTALNIANARLIAAAPDLAAEVIRLRAALNIICENVEATGSSHADRVAMIGNVANAAITEE